MIVLDLETSSADPFRGSILSIGAVDMARPEYPFYGECQLEDGAHVQPRAMEVNGFTEAQISDPSKPSVRQLLERFLSWYSQAADRTVAGHNVGYFDLRYLEIACVRHGLGHFGLETGNYRSVDLHTVGYAEFVRRGLPLPTKDGRSNLSLDAILALVGLDPEPKPHHALNGAKLEAEAFSRLLYGKPLFPECAKK
jgi:DNA polymerase-3 subunit epsilon